MNFRPSEADKREKRKRAIRFPLKVRNPPWLGRIHTAGHKTWCVLRALGLRTRYMNVDVNVDVDVDEDVDEDEDESNRVESSGVEANRV